MSALRSITGQEAADYARDGFVKLPAVVARDWIDRLRTVVAAHRPPQVAALVAELRLLCRGSPLVELAAQLDQGAARGDLADVLDAPSGKDTDLGAAFWIATDDMLVPERPSEGASEGASSLFVSRSRGADLGRTLCSMPPSGDAGFGLSSVETVPGAIIIHHHPGLEAARSAEDRVDRARDAGSAPGRNTAVAIRTIGGIDWEPDHTHARGFASGWGKGGASAA
ncbi:hypothetical protein [Sphingobium sp. SCG-1]|uniref:hypothetical protein n=1 Tax=Sphingobium sp. SCG-1 TaxID=2072936 RepID=UPI001670D704|nr:hypothetical protein [Sphingobium sp. SCG-1]